MSVDFSRLGGSNASDTIVEPRDLFNVLPSKMSKYVYPRDVQADVWSQWALRRAERDLTIKMNTGGGKTVVGLVILKACLNEGVGPAVYVAPSPPLVRQVIAEAAALGIETTEDPHSARYISGKSILVVNIHKLINGRSVFGVGDQGIRIAIGSLLLDDAHACMSASEDQFAIRVGSEHPLHTELLTLFYPELDKQAPARAIEVQLGDPEQNMVVPYWSWINHQPAVLRKLQNHRDSDAVKFVYPLLKNHLALCECVLGGSGTEISTRCLPIAMVPSFVAAKRRIFMSATFGNDGVLETHFGVKAADFRAISPNSTGDIGDRMILVPQHINPGISEAELKAYFVDWARSVNVVVLVPSDARAKAWADVAVETLRSANLSEGVARLRARAGITDSIIRIVG